MKKHFHVVVVGSGFGGSLAAMIARRLGFTTALLERGRHPRFAIGESSTPLANLLLEEIAAEYDLPFLRPLSKWGTWQKQCPELACGLKRGFTFYHHTFDTPFAPDPLRQRQLLVGASPADEIADTHWYRPDFDLYLARQAQDLGVEFLDHMDLSQAAAEPDGIRLHGTRDGESIEIMADFVVDATGPRGFLHRAFGLPEETFDSMPATQALFTHFRDVGPLPEEFSSPQRSPYPPEQAAVHHVFPGGWVWVLKFNNGITSAGVAATDAVANELCFKSGEPGWRRLLHRLPSLRTIFEPARALVPFIYSPRPTFRSAIVAGPRWALLPSAAGFIDPLLSTGFPLTLLGVARVARILQQNGSQMQSDLQDYERLTLLELDSAAQLVGALYATMDRLDLFQQLSLLYFAAASFSETARRLGNFHLADAFLLCRHPAFAASCRDLCQMVHHPLDASQTARFQRQIRATIEPFNVAGLTDAGRHPWYPALASDMLRGAAKVSATEAEVVAMLQKCGLNPS